MRRDEDGHGAFRIWRGHPVDGGVYRGSAFAVGTRHVATCRHVLDGKTASDHEIAGWAPQFWVDGFGLPAALRVDRLWCLPLKADREGDLALLEVRGSIPEPLQLTLAASIHRGATRPAQVASCAGV
jgi:hypothetical protein